MPQSCAVHCERIALGIYVQSACTHIADMFVLAASEIEIRTVGRRGKACQTVFVSKDGSVQETRELHRGVLAFGSFDAK